MTTLSCHPKHTVTTLLAMRKLAMHRKNIQAPTVHKGKAYMQCKASLLLASLRQVKLCNKPHVAHPCKQLGLAWTVILLSCYRSRCERAEDSRAEQVTWERQWPASSIKGRLEGFLARKGRMNLAVCLMPRMPAKTLHTIRLTFKPPFVTRCALSYITSTSKKLDVIRLCLQTNLSRHTGTASTCTMQSCTCIGQVAAKFGCSR